jgi:hypothetical protein
MTGSRRRLPIGGAVFVFRSKRADRLKVLVWDRTGLVLIHKRLEGGQVRLAAGAGRRHALVCGAVCGVVRGAGVGAGATGGAPSAAACRLSAAE